MQIIGLLKELTPGTCDSCGLTLVRATAVDVTWDAIGWPLFIYRPRRAEETITRMYKSLDEDHADGTGSLSLHVSLPLADHELPQLEPMVDDSFLAALESRDGIHMC